MDDTDLLGLENYIKSCGQFTVVVMNQTAKSLFPFFDGPDVLAGLLSHPVAVGIGGYASQMDTSGADFQKKQHIVSLQEK